MDERTPIPNDETERSATTEADAVHADEPATPSDPAPGHKKADPIWASRRQNEKARKARLLAAKVEREAKEDLCLAFVTSGMSFRQVSQRVGLSKTRVYELYRAALDRAANDTPDEFRELMRFRLDRLLQAAWIPALAGDVQANRLALQICDTQIKFEGQYPAVPIDLNATFEIRREISEAEILRTLAEMQADRIMEADAQRRAGAIDALVVDRPALGNGHSPNGHEA